VSNGGKAKVLVADDQDALRSLLCKLLSREGYEPVEARDGESAIELYRAVKPPVVVSDIMMPRMDGLTLLQVIKSIDPEAAVILMTGHGNEDILLKALQGGATNFFKKPFDVRGLIREINKIFQYKAETVRSRLFSPYLMEESKSFALLTGDPQYLPIVNQIALQLPCLLAESEILNLKIGIEEMIVNAIEHGNLGISATEKNLAIEEGKLGDLFAERLRSGDNGAKKVLVTSRISRDSFVVSVADEGEGFNWRALPELLPENLLAYNGRGIFLTKIYFDEVRYNEKGNEVTLVKNRKLAPPDQMKLSVSM
jgi:CheY-like chemotaxis protein/anti-sigma regulatory factor (Ser/Thr protein kinase)